MPSKDPAGEGALWLLKALERLFAEVDRGRLLDEIEDYRKRFPDTPAPGVARRIVGEMAFTSGVRGGILSVPRSVPGVGWALGFVGASVDTLALIREQSLLIFKVAALFGHSLYEQARIVEALAVFGILSGDADAVNQLEGVLKALPSGALRGAGVAVVREAAIAIGQRLARRGVLKWLPLIGIPLGGAMNFMSTEDVGWSAIRYYSRRNISQKLLGDLFTDEEQMRRALLDVYLFLHSSEKEIPKEVQTRAERLGRSIGVRDAEKVVAEAVAGRGPTPKSIAARLEDAADRAQIFERAVLMARSIESDYLQGFLLANLADGLELSEEERRRIAGDVQRFMTDTVENEPPGLAQRVGEAATDTLRSVAATGASSAAYVKRNLRNLLGLSEDKDVEKS
ncbi:MAG: hypothetical protein HYV63_33220 [Candidatus Schekmanbacteria bacterium]|nr:hypothetical protein [Candidatus Schekmanbacteria bacterium]